jgi:hypothetical protein
MSAEFADTLAASLTGYGARPFIEFDRRWYSGDEITWYIAQIDAALTRAGVESREPVGIVVRNRVPHAAAIQGFSAACRPAAIIYSYQSPQSIARDIKQLGLPAILADPEDWTPPVRQTIERIGSAGIALSLQPPTVELVSARTRFDPPDPRCRCPASTSSPVALRARRNASPSEPKCCNTPCCPSPSAKRRVPTIHPSWCTGPRKHGASGALASARHAELSR